MTSDRLEPPTPSGSEHRVVMTTVGTDELARTICRSVVEAGLVACAQLVPIGSVYRWQGEVVEDTEVLVLLKTRRERVGELTEALRARHPYEVPEIVELPVVGGWPAYLRWIDEQTAGE